MRKANTTKTKKITIDFTIYIIVVFFNSRSREYNGRYYNSISAWRVEKGSGTTAKPEEDEDLPF
ncbi:MAG: DUF3127 domain-containing protein [Candidatus Peribacteria bacterium]|nr:MAG: DUF3127 domain-containing protein [Candidatus Peribacteria bacterium]